ncbi:MAG: lysophospholipid acyltransferase family protein [Chloroflexota bacterium]|nr:lysophospholipid acyltransferase family protein [Chloroflexota bacterium]
MRRAIHLLLRFLVHTLIKLDVEGLENVPRTGPVLLLMSHTTFLDPVLACVLVPRVVIPMGKVELFRIPLFNQLLRWYGAFPVRRGEMDLQAFRYSFEALEQGRVLLIAPEGTRSEDGRLQQGKPGTAYIATRVDVPLVPMAIIGGEDFFSRLLQLRRTPVRVVVGPAFRLRKPGKVVRRQMIHQMTEEIMYQMARLMPPERRGVYSDLSKATEEYIVYEPVNREPALGGMKRVAPALGG